MQKKGFRHRRRGSRVQKQGKGSDAEEGDKSVGGVLIQMARLIHRMGEGGQTRSEG